MISLGTCLPAGFSTFDLASVDEEQPMDVKRRGRVWQTVQQEVVQRQMQTIFARRFVRRHHFRAGVLSVQHGSGAARRRATEPKRMFLCRRHGGLDCFLLAHSVIIFCAGARTHEVAVSETA
jgi:hypothetical protein